MKRKLADGSLKIHYYHRESGTPLEGKPGTAQFVASLAAAEGKAVARSKGTLAGLLRDFEKTAKWRALRESTQKEYRRVFKFWGGEQWGWVDMNSLADRAFRKDVLSWHDEFSAEKPREADNRVTILARVLSWAAKDANLKENVLDGFDRAYTSDRSDKIWLPEHAEAFLAAADPDMRLAFVLALHTGQRQGDILKMAWSQYDGTTISLRQSKTGTHVRVPCTVALKATLDGLPKRGLLIMLTKTDKEFKKRYFAEKWDQAYRAAGLKINVDAKTKKESHDLHFHDIRGTTVTMLFEAGCTVAEVASITGHSLRRAQEILDKYLSRTSGMATNAIAKFEAGMAKGATE